MRKVVDYCMENDPDSPEMIIIDELINQELCRKECGIRDERRRETLNDSEQELYDAKFKRYY